LFKFYNNFNGWRYRILAKRLKKYHICQFKFRKLEPNISI
jgi:hypothetical protein